jgi:hypothetical protein
MTPSCVSNGTHEPNCCRNVISVLRPPRVLVRCASTPNQPGCTGVLATHYAETARAADKTRDQIEVKSNAVRQAPGMWIKHELAKGG